MKKFDLFKMDIYHVLTFSILTFLTGNSCSKIEKTNEDIDYPAAYVINGESNSISIVNLETNELVESCKFKKGSWPHHIYANTDKDELIVSLTGADLSGGHAGHGSADASYMMVLRANDLKMLSYLKTDHTAHNGIFMKNGTEIWLPQMTEDGYILRLNSKNLKEIGTISVGAGPLEITTDINSTYAFVANGDGNSITVIDAETAEVVKTISVGDEPVGAWPALNNKMYVDCEVSKEVYEIDVSTLEVTDTIALGFTPAYVAYNNLTSELWVSDAEFGGIHTYELINGNWTELAFLGTGANAHAIGFNAAFTRAYVTNQFANSVSVIDTETLTKVIDIPVGYKPNGILILE